MNLVNPSVMKPQGCGGSEVLDEALADWAEAYGDQIVKDYADFLKAIESGRVTAQ